MRKPRASLLAAPVLLGDLVATLVARVPALRLAGAAGIMAAAALVVAVVVPPPPGAAIPASQPDPVSAGLFLRIGTAHDPTEPFTIEFDQPMDRATVAGALSVEPAAPYSISWDATGRVATVTPARAWRPDTLYRVTVGGTARSRDGGELAAPVRSVVLTGAAGTASLAPTMATLDAVRLDTSFRITLDQPASLAAVRAALRSDPPLAGDLVAESAPGTFRFQPFGNLAPDTDYRLWFEGLENRDGIAFAGMAPVSVHTVEAPLVTRITPRDDARKVARSAAIAVAFSERMDPALTEPAIRVTANGKAVAVRARWSADGRTLTLRPVKRLPYGATVKVRVDLRARSAAGAPIGAAELTQFTVRKAPAAGLVGIPTGAGGAVSGSWLAVEQYYLKLMNCTRTGGWVTSAGACSSPGGRDVAALRLNSAISSSVSRPYARLLATRGLCSHFIGGNPGDRLRANGFGGYNWGENIGCRSGNPYGAVLATHLFYQSERPYNGGHYRNLMNASFTQAGIGVWVASGRVRLVIDFYAG